MKKYFCLLLGLLLSLGIMAQDEFRFGYCDHEIATGNGYGAETAGEVSAAICVPQSKVKSFVGNQIARVEVGVISRINVRELKVWVRSSLNGENLAEQTISRASAGWNVLTFDKPYTVKAEDKDLYVGYTFVNAGSSHPVSFVGTGNAGTSFFKGSAADDWKDMAAVGSLSLEAVITGSSLPQYDLTLKSVNVTPNPAFGTNGYTVSGEVSNVALSDVRGFTLTIASNGTLPSTVKVATLVKSGATVSFKQDFASKGALDGPLKVTISELENGTDANLDDNTLTTEVQFLRNVLVEEFTTERCPNCPPAAAVLHQTLQSSSFYQARVVPVCHHSAFNTDWLTRKCDTDLLYLFNDNGTTYAPALSFDRHPFYESNYVKGELDNFVSINTRADFEECFDKAFAIPAHAMVGIKIVEAKSTATGTHVTLEVSVLRDSQYNPANPILTVYATEDDIKARSQQGADGDFYHQHVIRWDNGSWGDKVTFTNNTFKKTYTIDINEEWNTAKMHFVAFVSNYNATNRLDNIVENSVMVDCPYIQPAAKDEPITEQPSGEVMQNVVWTSNACAPGGDGKVAWTESSGFVPGVVTNGNKMYLYAPITLLTNIAAAWIVGEISADGKTVTFKTPQPYMVNNGTAGPETLYATRLTSAGVYDASDANLVFSFVDGNLTQTDGGVIALTNIKGQFYGYADTNIKITRIDEVANVLPDGAKLQSYVMQSSTGNVISRQTAQVAFCGNDVYISDPVGVANAWIKGSLSGNTITVPTHQYLGAGSGYPLYVNAGEMYTYSVTDPATGAPQTVTSYKVLDQDAITFTYDSETGVISTTQLLLINAGKTTLGVAYVGFDKPTYSPWTQVPAKPATPTIDNFIDLDPYASYGMRGCMLGVTVPSCDVDGAFVAQEDLYYQITFDGVPVTIAGTPYIPYYANYSDGDLGIYISASGDVHQLQFGNKPRKSVGIRTFYVVGEDVYASDENVYSIVDGQLVNGIAEISRDNRIELQTGYFDITGKRINPRNTKGIVIRKTAFNDGSVDSKKFVK